MTVQAIGDLSFGLRSQALAILALLSQTYPEFAEWDDELRRYKIAINTFAWYNGREKGVALKVRRELDEKDRDQDRPPNVLVITFGEDRSSDRVFVQQWVTESMEGPPTVEELDDRVERNLAVREEFPAFNYGPVVDYIRDAMKRFYESEGPAVATNVVRLPVGNLSGFSGKGSR